MTDKSNWKLVPVEPTVEMRAAGRDMLRDLSVEQLCTSDAADTYRAMVAASPSPTPSAGVDAAFTVASNLLRDGCTYADRKAAADFIRSALNPAPTPVEAGGEAITARYTNWRGETAERTFIPHRVFFGANEWHPEPQVLIEATDCEKGALRTFAAAGFALAKPSPAGGAVRGAVVADAVIDHTAAEIAGLVGPNDEAKAVEEAVKRALVFMRSVFTARLSSSATPEPALASHGPPIGERQASLRRAGETQAEPALAGGVRVKALTRPEREALFDATEDAVLLDWFSNRDDPQNARRVVVMAVVNRVLSIINGEA